MKKTFNYTVKEAIPAGTSVTVTVKHDAKPKPEPRPAPIPKKAIFSFDSDLTPEQIRDYEAQASSFTDGIAKKRGIRVKLDDSTLAVRNNNQIPFIDPDTGVMQASRSHGEPYHCQWSFFSKDLDEGYLHYGRTYEIDYHLKPINHGWWGSPSWPGWCVALQGWGPVYPKGYVNHYDDGTWRFSYMKDATAIRSQQVGNTSPPFFLRVAGGKWSVGVRPGHPHTPGWSEKRGRVPFTNGLAKWRIKYKPHRETGQLHAWLDGELAYSYHGPTCLTNPESLGSRGPLIQFGAYVGGYSLLETHPAVGFDVHRFSITEA